MQVGLVVGKEQIELRDFPEPEPAAGRAVVEISYCGICGTDLHAYHGGDPYNPAICGHEWAGTITALGAAPSGGAVEGLHEGDRVGIGVAPSCGACAECRSGDAAHCMNTMMGMLGIGPMAAKHGGFASAISIEAARLYPLRPGISDVSGAILEPATVAIHALRRTPLRLGDSVVVLGAGPIGLLILQCARSAGAGCVAVVEPEPSRAALASRLGATAVIDPKTDVVEERIQAICGPLGADVVFECAGIPATIDQSASLVRRGGVVSLVGLSAVPAEISPGTWLAREVRLVASLGYLHEEFDMAMQLVEDGRLQLEPMHSGTVGLSELDGAFRQLLAGGGDVKILVDPRKAT